MTIIGNNAPSENSFHSSSTAFGTDDGISLARRLRRMKRKLFLHQVNSHKDASRRGIAQRISVPQTVEFSDERNDSLTKNISNVSLVSLVKPRSS
mmetsp:Transcript_18879/g.29094  ORF Transcript_18879/g.29094 Transcript_18879/m.29094 type:complete len:95 (+) Transcript_18879:187-471(+)